MVGTMRRELSLAGRSRLNIIIYMYNIDKAKLGKPLLAVSDKT
jgi:hypothetical protein